MPTDQSYKSYSMERLVSNVLFGLFLHYITYSLNINRNNTVKTLTIEKKKRLSTQFKVTLAQNSQ